MSTSNFIVFVALLVVALFQMKSSYGAYPPITCHTPRMAKTFTISKSKVTFYEEKSFKHGREIASISQVRTKSSSSGFTKIINFEGQKYTIHVDDIGKFSEVDDYMTIQSKKGHQIIYPITCSYK